MGFMFFEIVLIQKLTLFLGYPTYSLTVTLFALLVFTGVGSFVSAGYHADRDRLLLILLGTLTALMIFYQLALGPIATMLSMTYGFAFVLALAVLIYLIGIIGLRRVPSAPAA